MDDDVGEHGLEALQHLTVHVPFLFVFSTSLSSPFIVKRIELDLQI